MTSSSGPRSLSVPVVLTLVLLLLTSCGGVMPGSEPTVTIAQAKVQTDQHVREVAATVFPGATLTADPAMRVAQCTEPQDGGPLGRVFATVSYRIGGVPAEDNAAAFDRAKRYWAERGYRITSDKRDFVSVEAPGPDFTSVALQESVDGSRILFLIGDSRCVWPDGTPTPRPGS